MQSLSHKVTNLNGTTVGGWLHKKKQRKATKASPSRSRRASIGPSSGWKVYSRLGSELDAVCSRSIAGAMQLQPRQEW